MATAIEPLNKVQFGLESTKGTLVAATKLIQGAGEAIEEQGIYRSAYPQGVRANVGGAGTIIGKGFGLKFQSELTAEEILWVLETGIRGGITPTAGGTGDYTYVYTPQLTTGIPTIKTATIEAIRSDGSTNHYYGEAGHGMTRSFEIEWAVNEIAKLSFEMFGRARQTDTPTGALAVYATREALVTNLLKVYLDTSWAGLGGTQLTGIVRRVKFACTTGYEPDYTLDGRSDLDFTGYKVGNLAAKLTLLLELDATGAAQFTKWRSNSLQYIRLKNTGTTVGALPKAVQIDGAYRMVAPPAMQVDGAQMLVACELESVYDTTGTKTLEFTAINGESAI